ncbi:MAG: SpoIIE family protein phosphatase [Leptospiraceae bacterium]|nr:SpoIIE family protein phosphatase [Leptospiraceae bacterium]
MDPVTRENKIQIPYQPEVSVRRILRILNLFRKKSEGYSIENLLGDVLNKSIIDKMVKDQNFWIPLEVEEQIIKKLSSIRDISEEVILAGKEVFFAIVFEFLPPHDQEIELLELLYRLPLIFNRYNRLIQIIPHTSIKEHLQYTFSSTGNKREKWYDLLFLYGILEACFSLYTVKESSFSLVDQRQEFPYLKPYFQIPSEYAGRKTLIEITWPENIKRVSRTDFSYEPIQQTINRTFIVSSVDTLEEKESYSLIDVQKLIEQSEKLYLEKRDLEAAVEVLSLLKNELMLKQKSLTKDLKMARNIQIGIIPQKIPDWRGIQFGIMFRPMQEVSGDYYDYFNFENNRLGILLSDVSGHGIPAAFITAISKLLFSNNKQDTPSEIFGHINYELIDLIKKQGYLTCFYGIIDSNYEITYALAGHPGPILYRYETGEILMLDGEGTYLGIFEEAREFYKDYKLKLEPGDKIFVYTDGMLEGKSDTGKEFDLEVLKETILKTRDLDVKKTTEFIETEYRNFCRGTDQSDDVTLLVFGLSLDMHRLEEYITLAEDYAFDSNYKNACELLEEAYSLFPNDSSILLMLGNYYTRRRMFDEAVHYIEDYNKIKKKNPRSYLLLAYCHYKRKDYQKAEIDLYRSISLDPQNRRALNLLFLVSVRENLISKAKNILEKIKLLYPDKKLTQRFENYMKNK